MSPRLPKVMRVFVIQDPRRSSPQIEAAIETLAGLEVVGRGSESTDIAAKLAALRPDVVLIDADGAALSADAIVEALGTKAGGPAIVTISESADDPSAFDTRALDCVHVRPVAGQIATVLERIPAASKKARRRTAKSPPPDDKVVLKPGLY